jgi:hypothetical protein
MHWAIVRQLRYLAGLDAATADASQETIKAAVAQANLVDSPELSADTPAGELPCGVPASYWLDLRTYHPTAVARELGIPILILQGGRDYQATISRPGAPVSPTTPTSPSGSTPSTTTCSPPARNHPRPPTTTTPHHIDEQIITAIANWITTQPPHVDPTHPDT